MSAGVSATSYPPAGTQGLKYPRAVLWAGLVLVVGALASAAAGWRQAGINDIRARVAVAETAERLVVEVLSVMHRYEYGMLSTRGAVLTAGENLTRDVFHRYSRTWDGGVQFPGTPGFGFARRVPETEEAAFVAAMRREGARDFAVRQFAPHVGDRYVIQYMEPVAGNELAIGLDLASEDRRRTAVTAATRDAAIRMSAPITLVQGDDDTGTSASFLLVLPIYPGGVTPRTIVEREQAVWGWAHMPLPMRDVLAQMQLDRDAYSLRIRDVTDAVNPAPFFQSDAGASATEAAIVQGLERNIYGRRWRIEVAAYPLFVERLNQLHPRTVVLAGLLATLLSAGLAGTLNITRQRKALVESERARLATIIDNSSDAIIGESLDGLIMSWNPAAERLFGYAETEVLGKSLADLLVPTEIHEEDTNLLLKVRNGEVVEPFDTVRLRRDGAALDVAITAGPIREANGRVIGAAKLIRDIRARKEEERRQRAAAEQATATALNLVALRDRALETISQGITIVDDKAPGSPIIYTNPAFAALTGYSTAEVVGRSLVSFFDVAAAPDVTARIAKARTEKRPWRLELESRRKDNTHFLNSMATSLILDRDGDIKYFVTVHEDVTEIRKREELLLEAQKMESVGQLTGGIAHDFNNLLTAIKSNAEDLKIDLKESPLCFRQAEIILQAADRGAGLVAQLMAFARKQELQPKTTDVNALLGPFMKLARSAVPANIAIDIRAEAKNPFVHVDPGRLDSALLNLCINSRDAMPDGGTITIETMNKELDADYMAENLDVPPGSYVMIAVTDTGTGMPPQVVEKAFSPFFTTKEVGKGTGLGLSMVYGFVKQSGGHAKIYSEVGFGTVIRIYLPALQRRPDEAGAAEDENAALSAGSGDILLVEDDALVRQSITNKLTSLGYRVLAVETALDAIEALKRSPHYDLVFTDIIMPGPMNGADLVREVQRCWPHINVLMTSGYTESTVLGKVQLPPGVKLLSKPYSNAELALYIREAMAPPRKEAV